MKCRCCYAYKPVFFGGLAVDDVCGMMRVYVWREVGVVYVVRCGAVREVGSGGGGEVQSRYVGCGWLMKYW